MSDRTVGIGTGPTPEQHKAAEEAEARLQTLLALGDVSQANAATGIYGDSGTGKTSLAATGAEYGWNRYHKITRYVAADLGGFGNKLLRLIRLGIVQAYNPLNHLEPFETMEELSMGYWPEKILDPFTGYAEPDVKLIPPQSTRYTVYCQMGHPVRSVASRGALNGFSLQCPTCKGAPVTTQTWGRVEETQVRAPWIKHVGLYVFDSGTALDDWAMSDMAERSAKNDPGVKDGNALSSTGARVLSGKYAFGANTVQHYGFAQNRMRAWIKNSRHIPGQVLPPIWTFLELRATDEQKNIAIFGPKIAGSAKTPELPSWLGNCLHSSKEANAKGLQVHRLWTVNHTDPGGNIPHLAKTRGEPGTLPPFLEDAEGEEPFTRCSLGHFFDLLEGALNRSARADAAQFPDAPIFQPLEGTESDEVLSQRDLAAKETGVVGPATRQMPMAGLPKPAGMPPLLNMPLPPGGQAPRPTLGVAPGVASGVASAPTSTPTPTSTPVPVPGAPKPGTIGSSSAQGSASGGPLRIPRPAAVLPLGTGATGSTTHTTTTTPIPPGGMPKK